MLVELQRFVEFSDTNRDWHSRKGLVFAPIAMNTDYVMWIRRWSAYGHNFCEVHFADRGETFIIAKTYEEMKRIINKWPPKQKLALIASAMKRIKSAVSAWMPA